MINEASFSKTITNITSQEELYKVLTKCLKNQIEVKFNMPFMSKEDYKELNSKSNNWRFATNFHYQDYYKNEGEGTLKRIDSKKYIIIDPDNNNFVTDNRLTINDLYTELVHSEDFEMYIDGNKIDFRNETNGAKSLTKNITSIDSLESFIKFLKLASKNNIKVKFEMPFAKTEYLEDLRNMDSSTRDKMKNDNSFREKYEVISDGEMQFISVNRYVYIKPYDQTLTGDLKLTFKDLYYNLLNNPEDYKMYIDGNEIEFTNGITEEIIMSESTDKQKIGKNPKFNDIANKAASKFKNKEETVESTDKAAPAEAPKADTKQKFVIELTFPYDGDSDLADAIESQLGKKAEVNEVLRTRRIMEFDFKNKEMFDAAMRTIQSTMKEKGKSDFKLDSRIEDDVETPAIEDSEELKELKESLNSIIEENRYPITVTLPLILESLKWASRTRASEQSILEYASKMVISNKKGSILDV